MAFRGLKKPEVSVILIIGPILIISVAGIIWKWPFGIQFLALFRFLRWSLTAIYTSVPILTLGYWFGRKVLHYHFDDSPTWSILVAWTMGAAIIIALGIILLGVGLYSVWVWILLALFLNMGIVCWLIYQRWQPIIKLWEHVIAPAQEDFLGKFSGSVKIWSVFILVILFLAFLHAMIPPNTLDELTYHLVLPQLWEFQHHWWVNVDNYQFAYPGNLEIIWGYALAIGGLHAPRLIVLIFGIMTIGGMRRWLKDSHFDSWTCEISLLFFLITPLAMVMLSITYDEWPLLLFIFLGWRSSRLYIKTENHAHVCLTAITWGICLGIKYSVIPVISLLGIEWMFHIFRRLSLRDVLVVSSILLVGGIALSGPWFIRNYVLTKDPIYPLGIMMPFQQPLSTTDNLPHVDYLTRYENLTGFWRWYPWLYHTTIDRTTDHRMHPGWLLLHVVVILFGWKRWKEKPWFTVFGLSIIFFYFSPAPRIYFPLMGLTWLFLPYCLNIFSQQRRLRLSISVLMVLFAFPSLSMSLHYWFMTYNRACQEYLIGLMDDKALLRTDGLITPVMEWVQNESPVESRIWLWCDYRTFYFDRWVRSSPAYELPVFLDIIRTKGTQELLQEIKKDNIDYIVVNTSNCSLPLKSVVTEKMRWTVSADIQKQLEIWMKNYVHLILKDHQFELYKVARQKI
jgi:hypothetical protein